MRNVNYTCKRQRRYEELAAANNLRKITMCDI